MAIGVHESQEYSQLKVCKEAISMFIWSEHHIILRQIFAVFNTCLYESLPCRHSCLLNFAMFLHTMVGIAWLQFTSF